MSLSFIVALLSTLLYAGFTIAYYYIGIPRIEFPTTLSAFLPYFWPIFWYFLWIKLPLLTYFLFKKEDGGVYKIRLSTGVIYFMWVLFLTAITVFITLDPTVGGSFSQRFGLGLQFFFQILKYLIPVVLFGFILTGTGKKILKFTEIFNHTPASLHSPFSLVAGWSVFILTFAIIGFFGWYNLFVFYGLLLASSAFSYKEIWEILVEFATTTFSVSGGKSGKVRFVINAALLVVLFVVLSTNIVNIVRPFPIGWDDLGVYMNFPKLMAFTESTANQTIMMWQSFTGIGFLHQSATLAFFLNNCFGGIFAILGIWAGIRFFSPKNNVIVSLPLLATTVFMSLPMIIFQQAKDMKLDAGLLGLSIFSIIALFLAFGQKEPKIRTLFYLLSGALMGIAFSVKFTTLMLVISAFSVIFYTSLGLLGFFGFTGMFVGIFTSLRLWDFLNVNYPKNFEHLLAFGAGLFVLGLLLCGLSVYLRKIKTSTLLTTLILPILLVLAGFSTTLGPWMIKNISEVGISKVTVASLLGGDARSFIPDYTKIHDAKKLEEIQAAQKQNAISQDGKTQNEDLGRYFGYEKGINNYLKLPVNLTLQSNQRGEFTDIGYIFLAILPGILLFRFRKKSYQIGYLAYIATLFVLFFFKDNFLGNLLTKLELPLGYIVIITVVLCPFVLFHFDHFEKIKNVEEDPYFLPFFGFLSMYVLLFVISAFGIVWYGIFMYFGFLALIGLSVDFPGAREKQTLSTGILVTCIALPYLIVSVIPHAWSNLPKDSLEYKIGRTTEFESVFTNRPEYLKVLSKLNLKDSALVNTEIRNSTTNIDLKKIFDNYPDANLIDTLGLLDMAVRLGVEQPTSQYIALAKEARTVRELAYKRILYPNADNTNTEKIYRIGTFLSYYITNNRSRFYEDSLVSGLDTYISNGDREIAAANIAKLGIKYLLVDLNAATIDQDPRKDLTRRYEKILDLVRSKKIRLITTDSPCLQAALELPNDPNYMNLAGVNYVSYSKDASGNITGAITPQTKEEFCAKVISQVISENRVTDKSFTGLQEIAQYVANKKPKNVDEINSLVRPLIGRSWMAAFEVLQ